MKRFLAFWTLVYLWSVETLYHVLVGLCWFHQGPSFSDGCLLLFSSVYIRCQDGLSAPTDKKHPDSQVQKSLPNSARTDTVAVSHRQLTHPYSSVHTFSLDRNSRNGGRGMSKKSKRAKRGRPITHFQQRPSVRSQ